MGGQAARLTVGSAHRGNRTTKHQLVMDVGDHEMAAGTQHPRELRYHRLELGDVNQRQRAHDHVHLVLLARAYPGSGADLLDWRPTRDYETEAELERDDLKQMLDAQNAYRRRRGARELTEEDAQRMAQEDDRVREGSRIDQEALAELDRELREREADR
jgi:hypothetical protein